MPSLCFVGGTVVLENALQSDGFVEVEGGRITRIGSAGQRPPAAQGVIDLRGRYLVPGYVDLHVHGGAGADFMDGTEEAFRTVCRSHLRHGTTSLLPTTTVARHDQHLNFLGLCRRLKADPAGGGPLPGAPLF